MTPSALLSLDDALERLLANALQLREPAFETVALAAAAGRVLATAQVAVLDVPPVDNSAMDGYAVRAADAGAGLPVSQRVAAGTSGDALAASSVARIFTGAPVPAGADAVVMQEDVQLEGERVVLPPVIRSGQHIRRRGQDCTVGSTLLARGRRLLPQDLGLLASQGIATVPVRPVLRVAVLCTGDELHEPGDAPLPPGAIYNSNRPMLCALLEGLGCEVIDLGIVEDRYESTCEALSRVAGSADLIISSGGVSVGEADFVRAAVAKLGEIALWRVAIKPGKPFAQGRVGDTPFIGLPGNPASAFVTFLLLARPFIGRLQGRELEDLPLFGARAEFTVAKPGTRREYLRVLLVNQQGELRARAQQNQSSGVLSAISASNALAVVPAGTTVAPGDWVNVLPLDSLLT